MFEAENCQRLETLSWCKCKHCTLKPRTIELLNGCCDEALEYDEYDASLKDTDAQLQDVLDNTYGDAQVLDNTYGDAEFKAIML